MKHHIHRLASVVCTVSVAIIIRCFAHYYAVSIPNECRSIQFTLFLYIKRQCILLIPIDEND